MSSWAGLVIALLGGAGTAFLFVGGLWLTLIRLPRLKWPAVWLLASFWGRSLLALALFYALAAGSGPRLLAAALGFFIARMILIYRWAVWPATERKREWT